MTFCKGFKLDGSRCKMKSNDYCFHHKSQIKSNLKKKSTQKSSRKKSSSKRTTSQKVILYTIGNCKKCNIARKNLIKEWGKENVIEYNARIMSHFATLTKRLGYKPQDKDFPQIFVTE